MAWTENHAEKYRQYCARDEYRRQQNLTRVARYGVFPKRVSFERYNYNIEELQKYFQKYVEEVAESAEKEKQIAKFHAGVALRKALSQTEPAVNLNGWFKASQQTVC